MPSEERILTTMLRFLIGTGARMNDGVRTLGEWVLKIPSCLYSHYNAYEKKEDYAVRQCVVQEVLRDLQVPIPERDCFTTVVNTRCKEIFFDESQYIFSQLWSDRTHKCNPPLS